VCKIWGSQAPQKINAQKNLLDNYLNIDSIGPTIFDLFILRLLGLVEIPIRENGQIHQRKDRQLDLIG